MIYQLINDFGCTKNDKNNKKLSIFNQEDIKNLKQENKILRQNIQQHVIENNKKSKLLQNEKQQNKNHKAKVSNIIFVNLLIKYMQNIMYDYFIQIQELISKNEKSNNLLKKQKQITKTNTNIGNDKIKKMKQEIQSLHKIVEINKTENIKLLENKKQENERLFNLVKQQKQKMKIQEIEVKFFSF